MPAFFRIGHLLSRKINHNANCLDDATLAHSLQSGCSLRRFHLLRKPGTRWNIGTNMPGLQRERRQGQPKNDEDKYRMGCHPATPCLPPRCRCDTGTPQSASLNPGA